MFPCRHGPAVQDSGANPKCRSGSWAVSDVLGWGQIVPAATTMGLSPHGQTWFGSVVCVKNGMLSLKDWRRNLEVGKLAGDWQIFLKCRNMQRLAIICFGGQVCQVKVSHCWKDFRERRSRKVFGRHGPRCRAKVDLLCSGNGVHCFSLFLQVL